MSHKMNTIRLNGVTYRAEFINQFVDTATNHEEQEVYQKVAAFLEEWFADGDTISLHTSGSTGTPKPIEVKKRHMINSAQLTCSFFNITQDTEMMLCLHVKYVAGKMMLVRAIVSGADLWITVPSGRPFEYFDHMIDFVAMVPLQVYNTLQHPIERERMAAATTVLVGGGILSKEIQDELNNFSNRFYSSYGMTETVSHIAVRALNGKGQSDWYTPFPQVNLSQTADGALCIAAPLVCDDKLLTNDVVEMLGDGRFKIIGRLDNVINSGGVKLQIEQIEQKLFAILKVPFVITYRSDVRLGSAVVLLIGSSNPEDMPSKEQLHDVLYPYEMPQSVYLIEEIPLTETNKIQRNSCHLLAEKLYQQTIQTHE